MVVDFESDYKAYKIYHFYLDCSAFALILEQQCNFITLLLVIFTFAPNNCSIGLHFNANFGCCCCCFLFIGSMAVCVRFMAIRNADFPLLFFFFLLFDSDGSLLFISEISSARFSEIFTLIQTMCAVVSAAHRRCGSFLLCSLFTPNGRISDDIFGPKWKWPIWCFNGNCCHTQVEMAVFGYMAQNFNGTPITSWYSRQLVFLNGLLGNGVRGPAQRAKFTVNGWLEERRKRSANSQSVGLIIYQAIGGPDSAAIVAEETSH